MTVNVFAFTCGTLTGPFGHLMEGGEGDIELPIPAFLIEHPKGRALFDTGMHPDCQHDPLARLGERLATLFQFAFRLPTLPRSRVVRWDREGENASAAVPAAVMALLPRWRAVSRARWGEEASSCTRAWGSVAASSATMARVRSVDRPSTTSTSMRPAG